MRKFEALELEASDFATDEKRNAAIIAMSDADLVTYRGEIVKNRNGKITRPLFIQRRAVELSEDGKTAIPV